MIINGATIEDRHVLELARVVGHHGLAHKLKSAHRFRSEVINLSTSERALVLRSLEAGSLELRALREQLMEHAAWRPPARTR